MIYINIYKIIYKTVKSPIEGIFKFLRSARLSPNIYSMKLRYQIHVTLSNSK